MSPAFIKGCTEVLPNARITFEKFLGNPLEIQQSQFVQLFTGQQLNTFFACFAFWIDAPTSNAKNHWRV